MVLSVNPAVTLEDEAVVLDFLLGRLRESSPMADGAAAIWEAAGAFTLERSEPELSRSGKFQSLVKARARA